MIKIRNQKSFYCDRYTQSRKANLHYKEKHLHKNSNSFQYENQCPRFLSSALRSIHLRRIYLTEATWVVQMSAAITRHQS